jgi:hypothetical protein
VTKPNTTALALFPPVSFGRRRSERLEPRSATFPWSSDGRRREVVHPQRGSPPFGKPCLGFNGLEAFKDFPAYRPNGGWAVMIPLERSMTRLQHLFQ